MIKRDDVFNDGTEHNINEHSEMAVIDISNASATWEEGQNDNTLNNINLKIKPGQLAVIIGPVGAGKVFKYFRSINKRTVRTR